MVPGSECSPLQCYGALIPRPLLPKLGEGELEAPVSLAEKVAEEEVPSPKMEEGKLEAPLPSWATRYTQVMFGFIFPAFAP